MSVGIILPEMSLLVLSYIKCSELVCLKMLKRAIFPFARTKKRKNNFVFRISLQSLKWVFKMFSLFPEVHN